MDLSFLQALDKGWIAGIVAYLIIGKVLDYVKTVKISKTAEKVSGHDAALVETLGEINQNIIAHTAMTRQVAFSLERTNRKIEVLEQNVSFITEDVKEIKQKQKEESK